MNRQVPTLGKLLVMVLFALSCFGLTLFLWMQFGGAVPFKPQSYRITATFPEATALVTEADIRIAGVGVGRVKKVVPGEDGRAVATLEIQSKFAPLPLGTKAILRQKTLLGETYVALSPPANPTGAVIPENGRIPNRDIGSTIELDELFATFDPPTRKYFQIWMQNLGKGLEGQGGNAGRSLVELQLLVHDLGGVSKTLDEQLPSLRAGLRDSKTVFNAATAQRGALTQAIVQSERVFRQTGNQEAALTAVIDKLPAFLTALKTGSKDVEVFARNTGPAATELEPTAKALAPATKALADVSPELNQLLDGVERVNENSVKGLPAINTTLKALPVLFEPLDPFLKQLNPIVEYASLYGNEITASLGNLTAATQGSTNASVEVNTRDANGLHFVRGAPVLQASSLTASPNRFSTDQANAYPQPGWTGTLGRLMDAYSAQSCGTVVPRIPDTDNAQMNQPESALRTTTSENTATVPDISLLDATRYSLFAPFGAFPNEPKGTTPSLVPAPTTPLTAPADCTVQRQFQLSAGKLTTYPQLPAAPTSTERSVTGN